MNYIYGTQNADVIDQNYSKPVTNDADFIKGGAGNDRITGLGGDDTIQGGAGADTLTGGPGIDRADYLQSPAGVSISADRGYESFFETPDNSEGTGDVFLDTFEILGGSNYKDYLFAADVPVGNLGTTIYGQGGADQLKGFGGNDYLDGGTGADAMSGGDGDDTYIVDDPGDTVWESTGPGLNPRPTGGVDKVFASVSFVLPSAYKNGGWVENLTLTGTGDINGTGNAVANEITGNSGKNVLNGMGGADTMRGLGGDDTYYVDDLGDKIVDTGGTDRVLTSVSYSLGASVQIEMFTTTSVAGTSAIKLTGNDFAQSIYGNAGANVINGKGGADLMRGLGGNDIYYVDHSGDKVVEAVKGGTDRVLTSVSHTLAAGSEIEDFSTTSSSGTIAINLTGNEFAQYITGNAGSNVINGRGAADIMKGLGGNDIYYVDNVGDKVIETSNNGTDRVLTSVSYTLAKGTQIEVFTTTDLSGTTALTLMGNEVSQRILGNAGTNLIGGGLGNDTLTGGAGRDSFLFDTKLNASANLDHITDFSVSDDTIRLDNTIFTSLVSTGSLASAAFKDLGVAGATVDSSDRILYDHTTGALSYDSDGNGSNPAVKFAVLDNHALLTYRDFLVV